MRLLLGSGGFTTPERRERWIEELDQFLGDIRRLLFIPYALADHDAYVAKIQELNFSGGREVVGIHRESNPIRAIENAEAVYVGGGNSFRLLAQAYQSKILDALRTRVRYGMPYLGVSAGTNFSCPTIKTTNDMPITHPPRLEALGLIPFQINPHYFSGAIHYTKDGTHFEKYGGETRDLRIQEFHEMNELPVVGLWEGEILRIEDGKYKLCGFGGARVFLKNKPSFDIPEKGILPIEDLS